MTSNKAIKKPINGGGAILLVSSLAGVFSFLFLQYLTVNASWRKQNASQWNQIVANEAAQSAFVLMEAALERRMWEMPPDNKCHKELSVSLEGKTDIGITYEVKANYDPKNKLLSMISSSKFKSATANFEKNLAIGDVTDYLIWSRYTGTNHLQTYSSSPLKIIGKNRKIYFEGPVRFGGTVYRPGFPPTESRDFSSTAPMLNPLEIKSVVQSERMIFQKGFSHNPYSPPKPDSFDLLGNLNQPNFYNLFTTTAPAGSRWQGTSGGVYITANYQNALDVIQKITDNTPVSSTDLKKQLYPKALFCGTSPLNAESGSDNGCFIDDPNRWLPWFYSYNGYANYGTNADFLCFAPPTSSKNCSDSTSFPNGFSNWRSKADLEGVLFTEDMQAPDTPVITWDNMDAFKEDASACGLIVDSTTGFDESNIDCELDKEATLPDYLSGKASACTNVYRINLENLETKMNNFDQNDYLTIDENTLARKVIYSAVPLEIVQTASGGLASDITNSIVRSKLSLWFVGENTHYWIPNQPDSTSPLDTAPNSIRELYFNTGPIGGEKENLKLIFLSPENIVINSPFRKRTTPSELLQYFPIVGGKIRPAYAIHTDWVHQENDGFKYGVRNINIKNVSILDNSEKFNYETNPFLSGLWNAQDWGERKYAIHNCLLSDGIPKEISNLTIPSNQQGILLPPSTSRFYNQTTVPPTISSLTGIPYVFSIQPSASSNINFQGSRIGLKFSNYAPTGRRRLDIPLDKRAATWYSHLAFLDFTGRRIAFSATDPFYFANPDVDCSVPIVTKSGGSFSVNLEVTKNWGTGFSLSAPTDSFKESGNFYANPLPILQTRND